MPNIDIVALGRTKQRWVAEGCAHFEKLLSRYTRISWHAVASPAGGTALAPAELKRREAPLLLKEIGRGTAVGLADSGKQYTSEAFARFLNRLHQTAGGRITFVIGGPYGLDPAVLERCDYVVSLSPLTFSHQLIRLVLLEQLFRAYSILQGTDYHK